MQIPAESVHDLEPEQITRSDIAAQLAGLDIELAHTDPHRRRDVYLVQSQWFYDTMLADEDIQHAVNGLAAITAKYEIDRGGLDEIAT